MSVNPLHCSLSIWSGLEGYCCWCNKQIPDGFTKKRKWCSGICLQSWRNQHRYFLARQITMKLARGRCDCARMANEERHVLCADCGRCSSQVRLLGASMTCDHIEPRFGIKAKFHCIHHTENLQILCSDCHLRKSEADELRFGL